MVISWVAGGQDNGCPVVQKMAGAMRSARSSVAWMRMSGDAVKREEEIAGRDLAKGDTKKGADFTDGAGASGASAVGNTQTAHFGISMLSVDFLRGWKKASPGISSKSGFYPRANILELGLEPADKLAQVQYLTLCTKVAFLFFKNLFLLYFKILFIYLF
ncbi:hypothetical protein HJG60_011919 [Phyllostomus discolor]|nr:hypothetical protein HJG60_011919 [Phyllostomus discolor]